MGTGLPWRLRREKNSEPPAKKFCTVRCGSFTMHRMVASSIPCNLSLCADRAQACEGDSHASSGIDVACPTTQSALAIASPHESPEDSWPSTSTGASSFCSNHQYSVTAVTTSTGTIAERYAYSACGQPKILDASGAVLQTSDLSLRYSFTGREWDATLALHHFRARWMSPSSGSFLARDPIGYGGGHSQYELFSSRALSKLDPTGKIAIDCFCHCFGGGSCGGREPLFPRYNVKFKVQIESSNYPNSTADSACSVACHDENDKKGNKPNNCVLESWNATGTTPYEPTASHCSIPDCIAGCSLAATSAFAICKTRAPLNVCVVLYGIVINSCSQSCVRRCDDRKSWILPEVLPDVSL